MSKTTNYQLTLWDYADEDFSPGRAREDLAENFTKLDTALKAEETMAKKDRDKLRTEMLKLIFGSYTGTGADSQQHISLGKRPKVVIIGQDTGFKCGGSSGYTYSGMALDGHSIMTAVTVDDDGFTLAKSTGSLYFNNINKVYYYMALL